jgi:hypothetical protein
MPKSNIAISWTPIVQWSVVLNTYPSEGGDYQIKQLVHVVDYSTVVIQS